MHEDVHDEFVGRLIKAYDQLKTRVGDPLEPDTLVGPLHTAAAVEQYKKVLNEVDAQGNNAKKERRQ